MGQTHDDDDELIWRGSILSPAPSPHVPFSPSSYHISYATNSIWFGPLALSLAWAGKEEETEEGARVTSSSHYPKYSFSLSGKDDGKTTGIPVVPTLP